MGGKAEEFSNIDSIGMLDKAAECFSDTVLEAYNSATELTYISSKTRPPPWDTPEVKDARRDMRNKLRKSIKKRKPRYDKLKRESRRKYEKVRNRTWTSKFREFCSKLEAKSDSKRISSLIKNSKSTSLGTIRKSNGSLTESPEETLKVMTEVHFDEQRDPSPGHEQPPANPQNVEQETEWDLEHIFSENRVRRALKEFSPLTAAGPDGTRPIMFRRVGST